MSKILEIKGRLTTLTIIHQSVVEEISELELKAEELADEMRRLYAEWNKLDEQEKKNSMVSDEEKAE